MDFTVDLIHLSPDDLSSTNSTPSPGWSVYAELDPSLKQVNFVISFALGVFGLSLNSLTLLTLLDRSIRGQCKYTLILSLTVVDFLSCLAALLYAHCDPSFYIPHNTWGQVLCKMVFNRYPYYVLSAVSAWHLVMISFERYLFVIYNEWYERNFGRKALLLLVGISWFFGLAVFSYCFSIYKQYDGICVLEWATSTGKLIATLQELTFMVILPIITMSFFHYHVYAKMREFNQLFDSNAPTNFASRNSVRLDTKKAGRSILVLLFVYAVSWAPNELLWAAYGLELFGLDDSIFTTLPFYITQILINVNGVCNPILYACSYVEFRKLLKMKLRTIFCCSCFSANRRGISDNLVNSQLSYPIYRETGENGTTITKAELSLSEESYGNFREIGTM